MLDTLLAADAFEQRLELPVNRWRQETRVLIGLADRGAVALDGGHLFISLGRGGDEGSYRRHVGG